MKKEQVILFALWIANGLYHLNNDGSWSYNNGNILCKDTEALVDKFIDEQAEEWAQEQYYKNK